MMGVHHAVSGAAAWIAVTSVSHAIPAWGFYPLSGGQVALGALICAGAALLPDADHPNATIAHSVPVAGKAVTSLVAATSGGHRHGTHSGLSAVVAIIACFIFPWFGLVTTTPMSPYVIGAGVVAAALLAFAVKVLKIVRSWFVAWLTGIAISAAITWFMPAQWVWLPAAVAIGWVTHLVGDFLTVGGLPIFWPLKPRPPKGWGNSPLWSNGGYFSLPLLGRAGSWREWVLAIPLWLYAVYGIAVSVGSLFSLPVA